MTALPDGDGTRAELEHLGWEALDEAGASKRDDYDSGYGYVLGRYESRLS